MKRDETKASYSMRTIERSFKVGALPVLTLSVSYPKITVSGNPSAQKQINRQIQTQVNHFCQEAAGELYKQAVEAYHDAKKNDFPFNRYEAVLSYEITYNQHGYLSLYRDQYTYTGGAHGATLRYSDTWNLSDGQTVPMANFFLESQDYRAFLLDQMIKQASEQSEKNPGTYFENYPALIVENFNEENYYLIPSGMAIYYQQYAIAPYSTGIVVFTIPYLTFRM